eukprot:433274-Pyramimonas_sp.AAC.1
MVSADHVTNRSGSSESSNCRHFRARGPAYGRNVRRASLCGRQIMLLIRPGHRNPETAVIF